METTKKICSGCGTLKPLGDFPPDKRAKDGKQAKCRPCINEWMKQRYRDTPVWSMLRRAKSRAAKAGFEFDLLPEDITPLPELCPVFLMPLRLSAGPQDPWSYSLDRVDNTRGYVRGNVAVISYKANRLKNDGTAEEHETIAAWIRKMESAKNDNAAKK